MGLHGATDLAIGDGIGIAQGLSVKVPQLGDRGDGGQGAGGAGAEELQSRGYRDGDVAGHVHAQHGGQDQIPTADAAPIAVLLLGHSHGRTQQHGH